MKGLNRPHRNERGQMTIEAVLIAVVLVGVSILISGYARQSGFASALVEGPWLVVQGMIEDGVWRKAGPASKAGHPSLIDRHGSVRGDNVPPT